MHEENGIGFKLGALTAAVESVCERVESLDHKIFGNGKIGVIKEIQLDVAALKQLKVERTIRWQLLKWSFHAVAAMLAFTWGTLVGASTWLPKLHALFRAMGW